ncbi:nucleotide-binding protein [Clostridium frigidicarnis]|uniref:Predicted nucleotide-binding protein containing TIR-like domain-containing protein n=1 Tax=Clostridium frigidicarnis TaxID=84698 RepID=A0A1I1A5B2_9CLOT|nr:nucleotide-binding protein [Clostridium frigidicarnis]SFB33125.1 Predicted nucleotide-binding protein containing TIR-like domain-containing protein [Clostridium frigidicarnis]
MKIEILRQLQEYIRSKSVDELKNIKPQVLKNKLGISDIELKELIDYLHDKGAMIYKYNISCLNCQSNHTIYENEIRKGNKECDECGEIINFNNYLQRASVLLLLDKNEILSLDESVDFKNYSIKKIIEIKEIRELKVIKTENKNKENNMEIFIGSSTQAANEIEEIALVVEEKGFKALPWNSRGKGVFRATNFTMENLINVADRVCAAIFIFNSDDETWYSSDNVTVKTTRDNVLFEYGLFMGKKGRNNVVFICKNKPKIASDLNGVTYIDADQPEYHMKAELKDWLASLNV